MLIVRKRFFHGWAVVAAVFLAGFASVVAFNPVLAVMMKPMAAEMGWSRGAIAGAMSAGSLASGGLALLVGPLMDKRGVRWPLALGVVVIGMCLIGVSQVTALWQFYLLFGLSRAISAGVVEMAASVAIANWFIAKRARAFGLATTGPRIGLAFMPPLALLLASALGWRGAWFGLGVTSWAIAVLPAILFIGRRPEDFGLAPDGRRAEEKSSPPSSQHVASPKPGALHAADGSWTAKDAVRSAPFWLLTAAQAVTMMASGGVNMHQLPHLTDRGIPTAIAVGVISSYAVWAMVGVLLWSYLAERFGVRPVLAAVSALSAVGVFILARVESVAAAYFYSAFYGLCFGGEMALFPLAWANYFGRASLGAINGLSRPIVMAFNAAGPVFAGWIFDSTGSYWVSFVVFIIVFLVGAALIFVARPARSASGR
ncbi:MAG: MFS transporter [Chloroflexi bacterium]|nr:MFS transporter [Chloroflexota bacterium]